ncbi:MAG TPA: hypothetical protein PJ988_08785 [Anaerolinea sp.]|nr:hypothetical protein [Anaerolinea sp.]
MNPADVLRILLLATIVVLAILALAYLRHRRLDWKTGLAWVLLALLVPVLGPILVISLRPTRPA